MICNEARRSPGEGIDHFQTKGLVGELADVTISKQVYDEGCRLMTFYEFPFIPIKVDHYVIVPDRCYIGDVVLFIFKDVLKYKELHHNPVLYTYADLQKSADLVLNYEIDGIKGHSTTTEKVKNTTRDVALEKEKVHVFRMPVVGKKILKDYRVTITEEILDFYFKYRKVIIS